MLNVYVCLGIDINIPRLFTSVNVGEEQAQAYYKFEYLLGNKSGMEYVKNISFPITIAVFCFLFLIWDVLDDKEFKREKDAK